jgi:hypothetical protein
MYTIGHVLPLIQAPLIIIRWLACLYQLTRSPTNMNLVAGSLTITTCVYSRPVFAQYFSASSYIRIQQ